MAHGHLHHHHGAGLERRDDHPAGAPPVVYKTVDNNSKPTGDSPNVGLGDPVAQTPTSSENDSTTAAATTHPKTTVAPTMTSGDMTAITVAPGATHPPTNTVLDSGASVAAATNSAGSASPTASGSSSANFSGGAKAGTAVGAICGVGLIAAIILLFWRKRKQNKLPASDDEKSSSPTPPMAESKALPEPPRLQVRPVTQFAPDLTPTSSVGLGLGAPATGLAPPAAAATASNVAPGTAVTSNPAAASRELSGNQTEAMPDRRSVHNPLETPPKDNAAPKNPFNDPIDPFGNQAEAPSPPDSNILAAVEEAPPANNTEPNSMPAGSAPENIPAGSEPAVAAGAGTASSPPATAAKSAGPAESAENKPPVAADTGATGAAGVGAAAIASSANHSEGKHAGRSHTRTPSPPDHPSRPLTPASATSSDAVSISSDKAATIATNGRGPSNVHRVQLDFAPSMSDELGLRTGQLVKLLHEYDDGWALCIRLDRSQQGVAPRSCLSARPLKPRARPPPNGLPVMTPNGPRMPPGPMGMPPPFRPPPTGRPMSPAGPRYPMPMPMPMPMPFGQPYQRPMSPVHFPPVPRSYSPVAGQPPLRSMSPGPYGPPGMRPKPAPYRSRSSTVGSTQTTMNDQHRPNQFAGAAPLPASVEPSAAPTAETPRNPETHQYGGFV